MVQIEWDYLGLPVHSSNSSVYLASNLHARDFNIHFSFIKLDFFSPKMFYRAVEPARVIQIKRGIPVLIQRNKLYSTSGVSLWFDSCIALLSLTLNSSIQNDCFVYLQLKN